MGWRIEVAPGAVKDIDGLGHEPARRILKFLHQRLSSLDDPRQIGEPLKGAKFGELWRYRVGDYRVIAEIQDGTLVVLVVRVGHRRKVYDR
ncbi:type II toxin-antitoxin system RelE/ParE family toxin [Glycocaulis profundi]|nr:type II toxin-antitoxin system RelE/ParE family toxin [Glycocaulis profundi]